jgi:hypothetical protein
MWISVVAGLLLVNAQAAERIVVSTAPPLDTQRLVDALRVYLGEFDIEVEVAPPDAADDLRQRIADARRLGESVRAVAVIHAESGTPGQVDIELTDLATDKTLIAGMPKAARDEDLYRTLALKIQAILRSTLSEARASLDPDSAVGRLVSEAPPPPASAPPGRLGLEAGYGALSFSAAGVVLQGLAVGGTYSFSRWIDVSLSTALLGSTHVSSGGVDTFATLVPVLLGVRARWRKDRLLLSAGPSAEVGVTSVTPLSSTVDVRSSHDILVALGAEVEAGLRIAGPAWAYLRGGGFGVVYGPRYEIEGVPVLDTSRLQISLSAGLGVRFP